MMVKQVCLIKSHRKKLDTYFIVRSHSDFKLCDLTQPIQVNPSTLCPLLVQLTDVRIVGLLQIIATLKINPF